MSKEKCGCGCHNHHHEHSHEEKCSCGHEHHHHHSHEHKHEHSEESCGCAMCQLSDLTKIGEEEECSCGCHNHHHEHSHEEKCSCGHEHHHHHNHEHKHEHSEESCGCAMCQLSDLTKIGEEEECSCGCHNHHHEHSHEEKCNCGHEHHHHHNHEHKHEHSEESCGCAMCQLSDLTKIGEEEECSCGCHNHHHEHSHEEKCNCGHEHHHHHHNHEHNHEHSEESCGCAMCQLENVKITEETIPAPVIPAKKLDLTKLPMSVLAGITAVCLVLSFLPVLSIFKAVFYAVPIVLWSIPLFKKGYSAAKRKSLDEHVLTSIAIIAAFLIGEYFEALMVSVLFAIGDFLELKAVQRSKKDIAAVVNIRPQKANLVKANGEVVEIQSKKLKIGDIIQVKVGERVPVDVTIIEGQSTMDKSAITGESAAVGVEKGDKVLSGEVNLTGVLTCRCETTFENSTASKIIQMVQESSAQKGQTEKFITKFAKYYTPAVLVMAILTMIVPPILNLGTFRMWLSRALVFLVASCPCALVISVPLAYFSGVGAMSKQGVLLKGTKFIETLANVKNVVCDKTGTITTGELKISEIKEFINCSYNMSEITALAESYSSHPVAKAICRELENVKVSADVKNVQEIAGKGVSLLLDGKKVLCGSARLMKENGISMENVPEANVYTAVDGVLIGCVMLSDIPRNDAASTIQKLKSLGVEKTIMLTGDSQISAKVVKEEVGIDEMHSSLLPQDKASLLKEIKKAGKTTIFVGDGINDAPVLAAADIGFAMGLGSDAAIESADAVLMSDKLSSLPKVIETARKTAKIVKVNIIFILVSKIIVLAAGLLGYAPMWLAVFADVGVSILTVLNAVRVLKIAEN